MLKYKYKLKSPSASWPFDVWSVCLGCFFCCLINPQIYSAALASDRANKSESQRLVSTSPLKLSSSWRTRRQVQVWVKSSFVAARSVLWVMCFFSMLGRILGCFLQYHLDWLSGHLIKRPIVAWSRALKGLMGSCAVVTWCFRLISIFD